jgi:hypothetical protein
MRNRTGQVVMIFLVYFICPTYSATIRNPKTDMCMDCGSNQLKQVKCSAASPSQTWINENRQFKCKASGKCLSTNPEDVVTHTECERYGKPNIWLRMVIYNTHRLRLFDGNKLCLNLNGNGGISFIRCDNVEEHNSLEVYYK